MTYNCSICYITTYRCIQQKFREKCIEMYELDLEHLLSEPGLA